MSTKYSSLSELEAESSKLRATIEQFCKHFTAGSAPDVLLGDCFRAGSGARIHEHGPEWAAKKLPYLHRTWQGRGAGEGDGTCDEYFRLLGGTLRFFPHDKTIPPPASFVVDPINREGFVRANCRLQSIATDVDWTEDFVFGFSDFDADGKIGLLEIWADGLSAHTAVEAKKA